MNAGLHSSRTWGRLGPLLAVLAVLCLMGGGLLIDRAAPETPNLFDKRWNGTVRTTWDLGLARGALTLLIASVAASALGLLLHTLLDRHRADASTWILLGSGLVGVLALLYAFGTAPLG